MKITVISILVAGALLGGSPACGENSQESSPDKSPGEGGAACPCPEAGTWSVTNLKLGGSCIYKGTEVPLRGSGKGRGQTIGVSSESGCDAIVVEAEAPEDLKSSGRVKMKRGEGCVYEASIDGRIISASEPGAIMGLPEQSRFALLWILSSTSQNPFDKCQDYELKAKWAASERDRATLFLETEVNCPGNEHYLESCLVKNTATLRRK